MDFFNKYLIDTKTNVENVHSIFLFVQKVYDKNLRFSIKYLIENGTLKPTGIPRSYTYLLMDGTLLSNLLKRYENFSLQEIRNEDFEFFKIIIFYVGKGTNNRKFSHFSDKTISKKQKKMEKIFENNHGVTVLQLFTETNDYIALSREYALIKALRKNEPSKITNTINSVAFGNMKDKWKTNEIINYGNMLIYNALAAAIKSHPSIVYRNDI